MSKTWYGHHIETIKGEDYVLHKDYTELQNKLDNEIDRLNNIINGMEKFFEYEYDNEVRPLNDRKISVWTICLDKLKELKESGNNEMD